MKLLASLTVLLAWAFATRAADTNEFLLRSHTNAAGQVLPYRLLLPRDYDASQSYPVILYLHGAAARGTDNVEPLNWGPMLFLDPTLRAKHHFLPGSTSMSASARLGRTGPERKRAPGKPAPRGLDRVGGKDSARAISPGPQTSVYHRCVHGGRRGMGGCDATAGIFRGSRPHLRRGVPRDGQQKVGASAGMGIPLG